MNIHNYVLEFSPQTLNTLKAKNKTKQNRHTHTKYASGVVVHAFKVEAGRSLQVQGSVVRVPGIRATKWGHASNQIGDWKDASVN